MSTQICQIRTGLLASDAWCIPDSECSLPVTERESCAAIETGIVQICESELQRNTIHRTAVKILDDRCPMAVDFHA